MSVHPSDCLSVCDTPVFCLNGYTHQKCFTVLLNRLRIGHTRLTHSFLLSGDDLHECGTYQCPLTVKHILVECVDLKMYEINILLLLPLKIYLIILKHIKS